MANRRISVLLLMGIIGSLLTGASLLTDMHLAFWGDHTIWWTHQSMKLPIEETKEDFELYIGGEPLWKHLSNVTLFSVGKNGKQYPVVSKDVTVRLNNWERVRASVLKRTTIIGFFFGVTITLVAIGLIQVFQRRKQYS